jgi:hypothetical protein
MSDKVRENRLRRMAARQGLALAKSRRRDQYAIDYGDYWLVDPDRNAIVYGEPGRFHLGLDDVEAYLKGGQGRGKTKTRRG